MTDPTACRSENANSNATGVHSKTVGRLLPASGSIAHFYSTFEDGALASFFQTGVVVDEADYQAG